MNKIYWEVIIMAICPKCGSYVPDDLRICTVCGCRTSKTDKNTIGENEYGKTTYSESEVNFAHDKYYGNLPGIGWFLGILLLFNIPLIGFVCCIIIACGATDSRVKRNFALAYLIVKIIFAAVAGIFWIYIASLLSEIEWNFVGNEILNAMKDFKISL